MKIAYFGFDLFYDCLQMLIDSGHEILKIFTCDVDGDYEQNVRTYAAAKEYGIEDDRIMIDPGVGFAKDYAMNMAVIANIERFFMLGYPILLGTSNKSVIGLALDLPIDERLFGTVATSVYAAGKGVQFLRVHDVKSNRQAALMAEKMLNYRL